MVYQELRFVLAEVVDDHGVVVWVVLLVTIPPLVSKLDVVLTMFFDGSGLTYTRFAVYPGTFLRECSFFVDHVILGDALQCVVIPNVDTVVDFL